MSRILRNHKKLFQISKIMKLFEKKSFQTHIHQWRLHTFFGAVAVPKSELAIVSDSFKIRHFLCLGFSGITKNPFQISKIWNYLKKKSFQTHIHQWRLHTFFGAVAVPKSELPIFSDSFKIRHFPCLEFSGITKNFFQISKIWNYLKNKLFNPTFTSDPFIGFLLVYQVHNQN